MNAEFQRTARREKKVLSDQCKEMEENNRMGKTRHLIKKTGDTKEISHAKTGTIKDKITKNLTEAEEIKKRLQKDTQKNYTEKILLTQITMMVWSLTYSQTSWSMKSSRP